MIADTRTTAAVFPLRRVAPGHWRSRDERWTFLRHFGDPHPQRWFAYVDADPELDDEYPANDGQGHVRLRDVARWAAAARLDDPPAGG